MSIKFDWKSAGRFQDELNSLNDGCFSRILANLSNLQAACVAERPDALPMLNALSQRVQAVCANVARFGGLVAFAGDAWRERENEAIRNVQESLRFLAGFSYSNGQPNASSSLAAVSPFDYPAGALERLPYYVDDRQAIWLNGILMPPSADINAALQNGEIVTAQTLGQYAAGFFGDGRVGAALVPGENFIFNGRELFVDFAHVDVVLKAGTSYADAMAIIKDYGRLGNVASIGAGTAAGLSLVTDLVVDASNRFGTRLKINPKNLFIYQETLAHGAGASIQEARGGRNDQIDAPVYAGASATFVIGKDDIGVILQEGSAISGTPMPDLDRSFMVNEHYVHLRASENAASPDVPVPVGGTIGELFITPLIFTPGTDRAINASSAFADGVQVIGAPIFAGLDTTITIGGYTIELNIGMSETPRNAPVAVSMPSERYEMGIAAFEMKRFPEWLAALTEYIEALNNSRIAKNQVAAPLIARSLEQILGLFFAPSADHAAAAPVTAERVRMEIVVDGLGESADVRLVTRQDDHAEERRIVGITPVGGDAAIAGGQNRLWEINAPVFARSSDVSIGGGVSVSDLSLIEPTPFAASTDHELTRSANDTGGARAIDAPVFAGTDTAIVGGTGEALGIAKGETASVDVGVNGAGDASERFIDPPAFAASVAGGIVMTNPPEAIKAIDAPAYVGTDTAIVGGTGEALGIAKGEMASVDVNINGAGAGNALPIDPLVFAATTDTTIAEAKPLEEMYAANIKPIWVSEWQTARSTCLEAIDFTAVGQDKDLPVTVARSLMAVMGLFIAPSTDKVLPILSDNRAAVSIALDGFAESFDTQLVVRQSDLRQIAGFTQKIAEELRQIGAARAIAGTDLSGLKPDTPLAEKGGDRSEMAVQNAAASAGGQDAVLVAVDNIRVEIRMLDARYNGTDAIIVNGACVNEIQIAPGLDEPFVRYLVRMAEGRFVLSADDSTTLKSTLVSGLDMLVGGREAKTISEPQFVSAATVLLATCANLQELFIKAEKLGEGIDVRFSASAPAASSAAGVSGMDEMLMVDLGDIPLGSISLGEQLPTGVQEARSTIDVDHAHAPKLNEQRVEAIKAARQALSLPGAVGADKESIILDLYDEEGNIKIDGAEGAAAKNEYVDEPMTLYGKVFRLPYKDFMSIAMPAASNNDDEEERRARKMEMTMYNDEEEEGGDKAASFLADIKKTVDDLLQGLDDPMERLRYYGF